MGLFVFLESLGNPLGGCGVLYIPPPWVCPGITLTGRPSAPWDPPTRFKRWSSDAFGSSQGELSCRFLSNIRIYKTNSRFLYRLLYIMHNLQRVICMYYTNIATSTTSPSFCSCLAYILQGFALGQCHYLQLRSLWLRKLQYCSVLFRDLLCSLLRYSGLLSNLYRCRLCHAISCFCDEY